MQRVLNVLARATREKFNVVLGRDELQGQLPKLERVRRIADLFMRSTGPLANPLCSPKREIVRPQSHSLADR
jgi:hypothetical protein